MAAYSGTATTNHRITSKMNADAPSGHARVQTRRNSRGTVDITCECGKVFSPTKTMWAEERFEGHQRRVGTTKPKSTPKPATEESKFVKTGTMYSAFDRFVCSNPRCAGSSVLATGRTIDGHRVTKVTASDVRAWPKNLGPMKCECGSLTATLNGRSVQFTTTTTKKEGTVPTNTKRRPGPTTTKRTATKTVSKPASTRRGTRVSSGDEDRAARKGKTTAASTKGNFAFSTKKEALKKIGTTRIAGEGQEVFMWQFAGRGVVQVKNENASVQMQFPKTGASVTQVQAAITHMQAALEA